MMTSEAVLEFLPVDSFWFLMGSNIRLSPAYSRFDQLTCCKQNLLSIVALDNLQLLFYCLQPIVGIHGLNRMRECQRFGPLKLSKFVTWLLLWRWLILWCLLHACHSLLHSLQHLSLHNQYLLQCWWWRWVGVVVAVIVLISDTVASVGHLMIVKRFEIEIQDSQLYASRYNDD
jgi:hypothetical protein